ncbi:MAG: hypothetical protein Kow0079_04020 [Vicingaceae bacterium]
MKNKLKNIAMIFGAVLFLASCAPKQPFTNAVKEKYNLDTEKIKKLQFYISQDVTLQRGDESNEEQKFDKDGKLIVQSSASVDRVYIPAGTPGVAVNVMEGNKIAVSFDENGDDSKFLVFGDPNNRGRYYLMGAEWNNGKGKINYGGKVYYVMPGGASAYIKFELKKVKKYKKTAKKVKGRRV